MIISVCYATPTKQVEISLKTVEDCTVAVAIEQSGILQQFPEINLSQTSVGIYGRLVTLYDKVKSGDRVEIYRSLPTDPKLARLLRARRIKWSLFR
nr:RnfH family protein [Coxiella endosymbiont of Amblyomma americanum]ABI83659.1 hypothetical protein [Coxiella endosymbiont of Amblyomma americanum]